MVLAVMEFVLRLEPSLIGLSLLKQFPGNLKSEIATRLTLPHSDNFTLIASSERVDHGPPLFIPKPRARFQWPADPADIAAGALPYREYDERGFCNPPGALSVGSPDILV